MGWLAELRIVFRHGRRDGRFHRRLNHYRWGYYSNGAPVYPFGYIPVLGFIVMTASAIWRYRLVDITPAFAAKEIINAMAEALLVLDHEGVIRVANPAACQMFGKEEAALLGSPIAAVGNAIPAAEPLDELILSGVIRDHELKLATAHNGIEALSVSSFVMRDPNQRPVAIVCLLRDITRRKQAEDRIRQLYEETKNQAVEPERANRVKDEFLSVMSHELRTPLNTVIGYVEILKDGMLGEISPRQEETLSTISKRSRELLETVNNILYVTWLQTEKVRVESQMVDLAEFLTELKADYDLPLSKPVTLQWDYPRDLPSL